MKKRWLLGLLWATCVFAQQPSNSNVIVVGNKAQPVELVHQSPIQQAITDAGTQGLVIIPADYQFPSETYTNPNGITVIDLRSNLITVPNLTVLGTLIAPGFGGGDITGTSLTVTGAASAASSTAGTFNATGAPAYEVNGVQGTCATMLGDCSNLSQTSAVESPTNKNLLTASNNNSIQLLCQSGSVTAIVGTGAAAAVYLCVIPQNTPGPGKCIEAEVAFTHSTGAASVTYNWSFVAHSAALANSGTAVSQASALGGGSSISICNGIGVQNSQTLNQKLTYFGGSTAAGGVTTTAIDIAAAGGADLAFTFNVANTDQVTPKFFLVKEIL